MVLSQATEVVDALSGAVEGRTDTTLLAVLVIILFALLLGGLIYLAMVLIPKAWDKFCVFMSDERNHRERLMAQSDESLKTAVVESHTFQREMVGKFELLQRETNEVVKSNTLAFVQVKERLEQDSAIQKDRGEKV